MVKHKNSISNGHFRKHWQKYVKTDFDKPLNKIKRRNKRKSKLTNINRYNFCPKNILRPVITNQTKMYNLKVRLGGGFSKNEINKSNVSHKIASSIGISVDKRRRRDNLKQSFNIMRLNNYLEKIKHISSKKNPFVGSLPKKFFIFKYLKKKNTKKIFENNKISAINSSPEKKEFLKAFEKLRNLK